LDYLPKIEYKSKKQAIQIEKANQECEKQGLHPKPKEIS
jgi:hypothetical protein